MIHADAGLPNKIKRNKKGRQKTRKLRKKLLLVATFEKNFRQKIKKKVEGVMIKIIRNNNRRHMRQKNEAEEQKKKAQHNGGKKKSMQKIKVENIDQKLNIWKKIKHKTKKTKPKKQIQNKSQGR